MLYFNKNELLSIIVDVSSYLEKKFNFYSFEILN